ncbi:hypothetical protein [Asanoa iriomotensis]|uniref:hypothetical protein n=1 Tax=Asanoa iriomotensis TaxID=234613 RepID=UPI001945817C|nr:hypothetical protein [Asanoa iriomotensis]
MSGVTLPDGRVVEYFDGGDPSGRPIVHPAADRSPSRRRQSTPPRVRAVGVIAGVGPWRDLADPSTEPEERACLALLDQGDLARARAGA